MRLLRKSQEILSLRNSCIWLNFKHPICALFSFTKISFIPSAFVDAPRPNGMAQRQRRDWRDALPIIAYSGKSRLRGAAEPLSAGAGVGRPFLALQDAFFRFLYSTFSLTLLPSLAD
jgi:hypothetical protein